MTRLTNLTSLTRATSPARCASVHPVGERPPARRRRTAVRIAALAVALPAFVPAAAFACPICFQAEENAVTDGVQVAVVVLVAITAAVLAGCATFLVRFLRRSAALDEVPPDTNRAPRTGALDHVAGAAPGPVPR
ncbi:MAG: hypothetical protein R2752_08880 [Vicinamibacterales bacterium]